MLWPRDQYHVVYGEIKKESGYGGCTLLILVAQDVDALCACEILCSMLRSDMISFALVPVNGYDDVEQVAKERLGPESEIRSIVVLNCGAIVNLKSLLSLQPEMKCYVIDSHRPMHLTNVYDTQQVVVLNDECLSTEDIPSDGSDIEQDDFEDELSDQDSSDSEAEIETEPFEQSQEKQDDVAEETESNITMAEKKEEEPDTTMTGDVPVEDEGKKSSRKQKLYDYYRGSYHGVPAAALMYDLAVQLNTNHNDKLWLAIVGLTKQYVYQEIETDAYNAMIRKYQDDVLALNQHTETLAADDQTEIRTIDDGKIDFIEDYRFMLYRHWSLYESMYHSNYVMSKLEIWRNSGKDELNSFFAKMGFSLKQVQQRFSFMSMDLKDKLELQVAEYKEEFNLTDVLFGTFNRRFGYKYQMSASDAVYAAAALLDSPPDLLTEDDEDADSQREQQSTYWQDNFHAAYTALSSKTEAGRSLLDQGIRLAMSMQKEIVHLALSIIERKLINRVRHFRYASLRVTEDEERFFYQPNVLSRLALLLVDIHREAGKWGEKSSFPLVLFCRSERRNTYMVVGVTCPQRSGEVHRNNLGIAFKLAAEQTGVQFRHNGFETSVLEIELMDLLEFVEQLHNVMNS